MKIHQLINEAVTSTEIVEFTAPYAADKGSNREDDMAAQKFAWKYKVLAACVDRHGPSGGWPEYVFWGPRSGVEKVARAHAGPDNGMTDEELLGDIKKSKRKYDAINPADAVAKRLEDLTTVMKQVKNAIMAPRGADVRELIVDDGGISLTVQYDFPEHRVRLPEIKTILKAVGGKVSMEHSGMHRMDFVYTYMIDFKDEITSAEAKKIKAALK